MRLQFLLIISALSLAQPILAQEGANAASGAVNSASAEQCVTFRRTGNDSFVLYNECSMPVNLAVCVEGATGCMVADDFARATLAAGTEFPTTYRSLQVLSYFACRAPATISFETAGQARCVGGEPVLPLLLASALKNPAAIITTADYPRNVRAEGTTRFEMVVNAEGRPRSCTITVSSGKVALDEATCNAFMKRARFTPAKDASGQPVAGRYRGNVTWKEP